MILGAVGITSTTMQSSQAAGTDTRETPALVHKTETSIPQGTASATDTAWEREQAAVQWDSDRDRMIDQIWDMAESTKQETNVDDISPEERERQEETPRNPKKRMYEERSKDEL